MAEITQSGGRPVIDYMARDYDSLLRAMRALIPEKLPEWKDFESETDFGNVLLQLFAHMGDILSYYQDRVANESFLGTARSRRSIIHHLCLIGYRLATASPASAMLTVSVAKNVTQTVTIRQGDAFATKSQKDRPGVRFEYTRPTPLVIDFNDESQYVTIGGRKVFDGIPVEEGRLIKDETLGLADGGPNQRFVLAHPRLILRSPGLAGQVNKDLVVISQTGADITEWTLRETLAFSREEQKDFIVEIDEEDRATIVFGDGGFGAKPTKGALIKASYRVGGGSAGNVPADSIQTIVGAKDLALLGAKVTNRKSATGGADSESIEHAVMHAPTVFRSLKRAVTAEDYKALALNFKGVGKVRAEAAGWNIVKLFVAPEGGGHVSDVLSANLLAYFEDKRPVTTILEIEDVDYADIYVTAEIGVKGYYAPAEVEEQVRKAAGAVLAFGRVDFAETLYLSKFYEAIEAVEGVEFVNIKEFRRAGPTDPAVEPTGRIALKANEIPKVPDDPAYAGGIKVAVVEGLA